MSTSSQTHNSLTDISSTSASVTLNTCVDVITLLLHAQLSSSSTGLVLKSIDGSPSVEGNKLPDGWTGTGEQGKSSNAHTLLYWLDGDDDVAEGGGNGGGGANHEFVVVASGFGKKATVHGSNEKTPTESTSVTIPASDLLQSSRLPFSFSGSSSSSSSTSSSDISILFTSSDAISTLHSQLSSLLPSSSSTPSSGSASRAPPPSPPPSSATSKPLSSPNSGYLPDGGGPLGIPTSFSGPSIGRSDLEPLGGLRNPLTIPRPLGSGGMHPTMGDLRMPGQYEEDGSWMGPGARPPGARFDPVGPFAGGAPWPTAPGGVGPAGGAGGRGRGWGQGGGGIVGTRRDPDAPGYSTSHDYDSMFG